MQKIQSRQQIDHCQMEVLVTFQKGETILSFGDHTGRCGILQSGEAHISMLSEDGEESLMGLLSVGDSFGEHYLPWMDCEGCYVIADTEARVLFININHVLKGCGQECEHHREMMQTLLLLSTRHAQEQAIRLNVLSQRSHREKLLTYLRYMREFNSGEDGFQIPMSLVSLANYLCIDRSAMMREIKKMNKEGLIVSSGRSFTLL